MQCVQCQHENPSDAKFCQQGAAPFAPVCSACGHQNTAAAQFCNQCGTALVAPPCATSSVPPMREAAEAERRFQALLLVVIPLLQRERRVTYRTLKYVLSLDEALLVAWEDLHWADPLAYDAAHPQPPGAVAGRGGRVHRCGSAGVGRADGSALVRGRDTPAQGDLAAAPGHPGCGPGGSLLPAGPRRRPPPGGQILGTLCCHQPGACGRPRTSARSPTTCCRRCTSALPRGLAGRI
jgi:Double zinc ribbon